jgi:hypothetical protein
VTLDFQEDSNVAQVYVMKTLPDELSPIGRKVAGVILACMEQGVLDVPVLPEIAQRVLTLINEPDSDATRLAKLIQSDQSLSAKLMHRIGFLHYMLQDGKFIHIKTALYRLVNDWQLKQ